MMTPREEIRARFEKNLARVNNFIDIFSALHGRPGRPGVLNADVLRAAVVFLHATLEDLLRSGEEQRLPAAPAKAFGRLRFMPQGEVDPKKGLERLTLVELADYRGQTVDEVLSRAWQARLERSNYNDEDDVIGALQRMGLEVEPFRGYLSDLTAMMKRRHLIAHRADVNERTGRGHHMASPMGVKEVKLWLERVEAFGSELMAKL